MNFAAKVVGANIRFEVVSQFSAASLMKKRHYRAKGGNVTGLA